jgi:hypothetical protein
LKLRFFLLFFRRKTFGETAKKALSGEYDLVRQVVEERQTPHIFMGIMTPG